MKCQVVGARELVAAWHVANDIADIFKCRYFQVRDKSVPGERVPFYFTHYLPFFFLVGFPFFFALFLVDFIFLFEFSGGVALSLSPAPFFVAEGWGFVVFFVVVFFAWASLLGAPFKYLTFVSPSHLSF